jgi:hypothetical protein
MAVANIWITKLNRNLASTRIRDSLTIEHISDTQVVYTLRELDVRVRGEVTYHVQ